MLALTIKQPWASLIVHHGKDIENRTWPTKIRDRIAIHSSKRMEFVEQEAASCLALEITGKIPFTREHELGAIIGLADIVDCVESHPSPWFCGPYGFVLARVHPLPKPVPCRGALGFWQVPPEIAREARLLASGLTFK